MSGWRMAITAVAALLRHLAAYWLLLNSVCLLLAANQLLPALPWPWPFGNDAGQLLGPALAAAICGGITAFPPRGPIHWLLPLGVSLSCTLLLNLTIVLTWSLNNSVRQISHPNAAPLPLPELAWSLLLAAGICALSSLYDARQRRLATTHKHHEDA